VPDMDYSGLVVEVLPVEATDFARLHAAQNPQKDRETAPFVRDRGVYEGPQFVAGQNALYAHGFMGRFYLGEGVRLRLVPLYSVAQGYPDRIVCMARLICPPDRRARASSRGPARQ
jgi:hypothetical protein